MAAQVIDVAKRPIPQG